MSLTTEREHPARRSGIHSLWRFRAYLRPHRGVMVLMLVTALAGVGISLSIPLVTAALIDGPIADGEAWAIVPLGLLALALGVLEAGLIFLRRWFQANAVLGIETALRDDLYARLQELTMEFHTRWPSGQLLSRATVDLSAIRRFFGFGLLFLVINTVQLAVTIGLMIHLHLPLGILVAGFALPIIVLTRRFQREYSLISRRVQEEQGDLATAIEEGAVGIRVIKAFGRRRHVYDSFDDKARKLYGSSVDKVRLSARFWTFLEVIPNLGLVLVLLFGALAVGRGELTAGALVAFITLLLQLIWPVAALGFILAMAQEAMTAGDRLGEIFDSVPDIVGGDVELERPRGRLRFEGVGFRFPDSAEEVLHDVHLDVVPGETVAVVGATGSGKTALTALVPRLYDVTSGRVTIDGVDVRELTLANLRAIVATAFEEPTLFSMSARENLTLGSPDATDEEIRSAVEIAQAAFVYDLPWGLDTRIGEQGLSLSGGQRQRLALARAVLARPKILVLDDTLSALDVHTEALVEEALRRVLRDATGIVVAHRASTVLLADKVALLQDGTISHVGTHHELLRDVPVYRELLGQDAEDLDVEEVLQ
ncbi:MAG: ATP-binding cassette domain-containing protein [Propionibacteriales bacterium]|nr:ATP-binding cassette domain-containing protein [Propionibacteriales bacterium]